MAGLIFCYIFVFKQMKIRDSQVEALQVEKDQLDSQLWEINAKYNQVSIPILLYKHAITVGFAISMHILALPPTHTHTTTHTRTRTHTHTHTHTHQEKEELLSKVSELEDELHTAREERERVNSELQLSIKQSSSLKEVCVRVRVH